MRSFLNPARETSRVRALFPKPVTIRILVVADNILTFKVDDEGFSLIRLCDILRESSNASETFVVTTAHRSKEDRGANLPDFKFDQVSDTGKNVFSIEEFEELWLFGKDGELSPLKLSSRELKIISDFMEAGGGVFATGDHQDLGFALCGELPRVRTMRKWRFNVRSPFKAPDRNGPTRIDTLRVGTSGGFHVNDQADSIPQEISPKFFLDDNGLFSHPHPLLDDGEFPITTLPDHMHEGMCTIPRTLNDTYAFDGDDPRDEYPRMLEVNARVSPDVVAVAMSAGGLVDPIDDIVPVEPSCFKIITAYDGHYVKHFKGGSEFRIGRAVVDSSFHHFVDLNLKGFFDNQGVPLPVFSPIKRYFLNIRRWLKPEPFQRGHYLDLLLALRYSPELMEEFSPPITFDFREVLYIGKIVWSGLSVILSPTHAKVGTLVLAELLPETIRQEVKDLLDPWFPITPKQHGPKLLVSPVVMTRLVLGSAILGIAAQTNEDLYAERGLPTDSTSRSHHLSRLAGYGLGEGAKSFSGIFKESHDMLRRLSEKVSSLP